MWKRAHRCNYNILYSIFVNLSDHLQEMQCSKPQCIPISPISRHGKPFQNVKLSKTWKTATIWMPDCLPASSTACYQACTLPGPTALPQNAGTLYPDTSPPTDNSLATNHRPFPGMENLFYTNSSLPSCLLHCLLPSLHSPWTHCIASECWHTLSRHLSTHGQLTCH